MHICYAQKLVYEGASIMSATHLQYFQTMSSNPPTSYESKETEKKLNT